MSNKIDRRDFLKKSVCTTAGAIAAPGIILSSCSGKKEPKLDLDAVDVPEILTKAPDGKPLRAGLIGCGGRGTGAAENFVEAGDGLTIVAMGDIFEDKLKAVGVALGTVYHHAMLAVAAADLT